MRYLIILFLLIPSLCFAGVDFDGTDDYIDLPDAIHDFSGEFSITAWINQDSDGSLQTIVAKDQDGNNFAFVFFVSSIKELGFGCKDLGSQTFATPHPTTINAGTWYHVAVVVDGAGDATLYVNGDTPTTSALGDRNDKGSLRIGETPDAFWGSIDGSITEVTIWKTALTDEQVELQADSNRKRLSLEINSSNLAGMWALDDGADGTANCFNGSAGFLDISGNGNHGTGNDGANNTGLICEAETLLSYP